MLSSLTVRRFKSLVDIKKLTLGRINVIIGANGAGKSNLLEAVGVLGAASFGRVDDETLLRRGVRPGVPALYKTAFPGITGAPHISFGTVSTRGASYDVTLWNPLTNPSPAWRFKTETVREADKQEPIVSRSTTSVGKHNQEQGQAALETFKFKPGNAALELVDILRNYSIYCPNTPSLRGLIQDQQSREPVGLSGGRLPEAIDELILEGKRDEALASKLDEVRSLIEWARDFSSAPSTEVPLSPSAARSRLVVQFIDRFMATRRNKLTGFDASEGALYVLFCAVLALHPRAPRCLAIDNVDQALNPRLAKELMTRICEWTAFTKKQWLLTAHNPAILDGLPLQDPNIRLFAMDRDSNGHTRISRIDLEKALSKRPDETWTLSRMWMNGYLGAVPNV
jgi:hypothetical protein